MRLKISKNSIMNKVPQGIESWARFFTWMFGMILAILTVVAVLPLLTGNVRPTLLIMLILFLIAGLVVFVSDVQHRFAQRVKTPEKQTGILMNIKWTARNRWILIGLLVLAAVILVTIFVPRQLQLDPQGYQTFFIAFAGIGAWVTGIALAVFAYQQYKLRQTEHRLLFEPQILLTSGNISITGLRTYPFLEKPEPFQIKWTVVIQNTSQIPLLIEHMEVYVKLEKDSERQAFLTPTYCHVVEPNNLTTPFEVTLTKPQRIVWIVEGSAGDIFDYVSGDSGKRDFIFIFRVLAKNPRDPGGPFLSQETLTWPIHVPKDANWVSKTPFLDTHEKQD